MTPEVDPWQEVHVYSISFKYYIWLWSYSKKCDLTKCHGWLITMTELGCQTSTSPMIMEMDVRILRKIGNKKWPEGNLRTRK